MNMRHRRNFFIIGLTFTALYVASYFITCKPIYLCLQDDKDHFISSYDYPFHHGGLYGKGPVAAFYSPIHALDRNLLRRNNWHIKSTENALSKLVYAF
jgi:hypothetical protein